MQTFNKSRWHTLVLFVAVGHATNPNNERNQLKMLFGAIILIWPAELSCPTIGNGSPMPDNNLDTQVSPSGFWKCLQFKLLSIDP